MSWDAQLTTECCGSDRGEWGYTGNTSGIVNLALATAGYPSDQTWWKRISGLTGKDAAVLLAAAVNEIQSNRSTYEAMNPENGWGDTAGILAQLRSMLDACSIDTPTRWTIHG